MPTETLPQVNRQLKIDPVTYVCPVTGDTWKRGGYAVSLSEGLVHTGRSYDDSLPMVPAGHRMADVDLIAYIAQETARLKAEGRNPRELLEDPIFAHQIKGDPYRWEHTHIILRPPEGANDFTKYLETDAHGRKYSRVDRYAGDRLVAEGTVMPWGKGSKVVAINPVTGLVAAVSEGSEPQHVMHYYFEPNKGEIAVVLGGAWSCAVHDRCLAFDAVSGRSGSAHGAAFRLVQGSLEEIQSAIVERFIKDQRSYDLGFQTGSTIGRLEGEKTGMDEGVRQVLIDLAKMPVLEVIRKYER